MLIRDVYHCTPAELDKQDATKVEMHKSFLGIENEERHIEGKRAEQRNRMKKH